LKPAGIDYDPMVISHHLSWTNLLITIIIIIALLCLAKYAWSQRKILQNMLIKPFPQKVRSFIGTSMIPLPTLPTTTGQPGWPASLVTSDNVAPIV
jgi:hypothetical protein